MKHEGHDAGAACPAGCPHHPAPPAGPAPNVGDGGPTHGHGHKQGHGHGMPHRFADAAAWSREFDAPDRDAWQKPDEVIAALQLPRDARIADVGAGTGYFAVRLARAAPQGQVLAVDVEPDMVRFVDARAAKEGLLNLRGRITPTDRADIDDGTDLVLVVDTYHHIGDRVAYFTALRAKLSPRGRLAIIDFRPTSDRGPPKEHKLADDVVQRELEAAGFARVASHDFLPDQYFLVFARSAH
jgi:cyclopropane fatty-acyl-phospholipid synthase-like methyltransferase